MKFIIILIAALIFTGCKSADSEIKKQAALQKKAEISQAAIEKNQDKIEDKGKSFVYGSKYALGHETNISPAIEVTGRFLDLAQLTLGNPSLADSATMRGIVDDLLLKYKIDLTLEKEKAEEYKKKSDLAEARLISFTGKIIELQENNDILVKKHEADLAKLEKRNEENAIKAGKWDSENWGLQAFNPFTDIFKLFKKLVVLGLIAAVLVVVFNVLEIFFPGLSIVSFIFGAFGKIVMKIFPRVKSAAGVVSVKVMDTLTQLVKATDEIFKKLKTAPLEEELVEHYPPDYKFTKTEVLTLLNKLTDRTIEELKNELKAATDADSRAIISAAKAKAGIKQEKEVADI